MNNINIIGWINSEIQENRNEDRNWVTFTVSVKRKFANDVFDKFFCIAFNKAADRIIESCKKGDIIGLEGSMQSYQENDDSPLIYKLMVNYITFLPQKNKSNEDKKSDIENNDVDFVPYTEEDGFTDELPF